MAKSSAGKQGPKVRSDCYIEITYKRIGGIRLEVKSKVDVMYGESIRSTILDMCKFFDIKLFDTLPGNTIESIVCLPEFILFACCNSQHG